MTLFKRIRTIKRERYVVHTSDNVAFMRTMQPGIVDLTVTSPPYDELRDYHGGWVFDFPAVAAELYRVTKDGGVVVWVVADATVDGSETGTSFRQALGFKEIGFKLHDTMIYSKKNYLPLTHNRYEQQFEYMFVFSKGRPKAFNGVRMPSSMTSGGGTFFNKDGTKRDSHTERGLNPDKLLPNIWQYVIGQNRSGHPAAFPLDLARDHILSWSNEADLVFDPFTGSGTTGKAALQLGRYFVGTEISPEFANLARSRCASYFTDDDWD